MRDIPLDLAGRRLSALLAILAQVMDDAVHEWLEHEGFGDLRGAPGIAFELAKPGGARLTGMAQQAGITKQAMAEQVGRLEKLGYLERVPDPGDRRAKLIVVTAKGEAARAAAADAIGRLEAEWMAFLGGDAVRFREAVEGLVVGFGWHHVH